MLKPRWRKVLCDITGNRARTLLVIASITVGIFAVGVVQHIQTIIVSQMQQDYRVSNAAHATIFASGIDDELLEAIRHIPNVADAAGSASLNLNVAVEPGKWEQINIHKVPDQAAEMRVSRAVLVYQVNDAQPRGAEQSHWPGKNEIVLERSSLSAADALPANLVVGDALWVEDAENRQRSLTLTGFVYDASQPPSSFRGSATGYVSEETFVRLGGSTTYNTLQLRVAGTPEQVTNSDYVRAIADKVAAKIEKSGRTVQRVLVMRPGRLPLQDLFDAISLILTPLGILALVLGSFLVINTMSALIAQQTRQIGMMKAIGAERSQIVGMYLTAVLIYSLVALVIAILATLFLASLLEGFLGGFINIATPGFVMPANVLWLQVAIGLLVPICTALYPILRGAAITVREAISDYGAARPQFGASWFDRLIASIQGLSRPVQISVRNTFRRRGRLILTLITLTMGGMIFMTVGSVRSSLNQNVEEALAFNRFDLQVQLSRAYRATKVDQLLRTLPEVGVIEHWGNGQAIRLRPDGTQSDAITINALPAASVMVSPTLASGRWLVAGDQNAIVLAQSIRSAEPDIQLGDVITLEMDSKERGWTVVGFADSSQFGGGVSAYVNYDYFARISNNVGKTQRTLINLAPTATVAATAFIPVLEDALTRANIEVTLIQAIDFVRNITRNFFNIIVFMLLVMGVLIAFVGAIGLTGAMSTNVLERTREIGVMRAIGAADGAVLRIVLVEGTLIGLISWLIGALLAYPIGYLLSAAIGLALFQAPLPYVFSSAGVFQWLAVVIGLAALASYLPARNASRLTVRETLAYE
jgi:putative ABC transport system permease protein